MKMMRQTLMATTVASLLSLPSFAGDGMTEEAFAGLMQLQGQWQGTLDKSDGTSVNLQLNYTSKSNGSALLEESSEDDVEMLNIFNIQEGTGINPLLRTDEQAGIETGLRRGRGDQVQNRRC